MKILVANNQLDRLGGTETFTYAMIERLMDLGYDVEYFSFKLGVVSDRIENELKVRFKSEKSYDLILANHQNCIQKLFHYGFIIQTCHGIYPYLEQPSKFADYHVAVTEEILIHLRKKGFNRSQIIYNGLNLNRFRAIRPLNFELKSILSLCQSEEINIQLSEICRSIGISFNHINKFEKQVWEIEKEINEHDMVFGIGRSAYEAIACERPVIVYDDRPYSEPLGDGYIRDKEFFLEILKNNCSGRRFTKKFNVNDIKEEIKKYDRQDGELLRSFAEEFFDISKNINSYLRVYSENSISSRKKVILLKKLKWLKLILYKLRMKVKKTIKRIL